MSAARRMPAEGIDWAELRRRVEATGVAIAAGGSRTGESAARLLHERAVRLARPETERPDEQPLELIGFRRAGESWAIGARHVLEIVSVDAFTPLPLTEPDIIGATQWRGHPLVLREAVPGAEPGTSAWAVVLGGRTPAFALVADEMPRLVLVPRSEMAAADSESTAERPWLLGITADAQLIIDGAAFIQAKMGGAR